MRVYKIYGAVTKLSGSCTQSINAGPRGLVEDTTSNNSLRRRIARKIVSPLIRAVNPGERFPQNSRDTAARAKCAKAWAGILFPLLALARNGRSKRNSSVGSSRY